MAKKKRVDLGQVVSVTANGQNARAVIGVGDLKDRRRSYEAFLKKRDWPDEESRPILELRGDSGVVIESSVGE
ncbi:MAG: hypothetical protein QM496_01945 [Verrucomicrobiota bacterium]